MPWASPVTDPKKPFHNPFAALDKLSGIAPAPPAAPPERPAPAAPTGHITRAGVRLERAGRGGKAATAIPRRDGQDLGRWLKDLKAALGCGGAVEDDRIVLQGDHRERLRTVLAARGVRKVTVA